MATAPVVHTSFQYVGEIVKYSIDFTNVVADAGANSSSVSWTSSDTDKMTVASSALSTNTASIVATALAAGCVLLKCELTLDDSPAQVHTRYIRVTIKTESC